MESARWLFSDNLGGMWFATAPRMRTCLASLFLLSLSAAGCSSSTEGATSSAPAPEPEAAAAATLSDADRALLGSYEIPLRSTSAGAGSYSQRMRLDFVAGAKGVEAYLQSTNFFGLGLARPEVTLTAEKALLEFTMQGRTARLTVARRENGAPGRAVFEGYSGTTPYEGEVGPDITPPQITSQGGNAPPWEAQLVRFSETLRAKDVILPEGGPLAYSLSAIEGTPWIGGVGVRKALSSAWDGETAASLSGLTAKDPSGNSLKLQQRDVYFQPVGKAVTAYDFANDNPAFPQVVSRLASASDCDGAPSCIRVSQGAKLGLRIAAGSRAVRVRFALRAGQFKGVPPKSTVVLSGVVAPGDGSVTSPLPKLEVAWTPEAAPTATRAFATAYADLVIPLPKIDAETGITLQFDGEPRDPAPVVSGTTPTPSVPSQTVEARHMVMLVRSARAE